MWIKPVRQSRGFTLIELLVAITIFAAGLLSVAGMQLTGIRHTSLANSNSVAGSVAQGVLEEILAREATDPFFDVDDVSPVAWDFDSDVIGVNNLTVNGAGVFSATIQRDADNPTNNITRVDVAVSYTKGTVTRTVSLTGFKRSI